MKSIIYTDPIGLANVTKNLNIAIAKILHNNRQGLIAAGHYILKEALRYTPVEYGPLKASGTVIWDKSPANRNDFKGPVRSRERKATREFIREIKNKLKAEKSKTNFTVGIGFGATYSLWVHEIMPPEVNHPNGGSAKFLEKALWNKKEILKIIKDFSKIKPTPIKK